VDLILSHWTNAVLQCVRSHFTSVRRILMIAHVSYFMIAHVSYFFFHSFGIWSETRNGLQWSTRWQTKLPRRPYHSNHLLSKSPVANSGSFAGNDLHNKGDEFWFHPVHKTRAILRSWVLFPTLKQATSHMSSRWHVLHATHCNTLQHTATHCNTLPHTATHCNTPRLTCQADDTSCDP